MPLGSPPSTPKLDSVSPELGSAGGAWSLCELRGHLTTLPAAARHCAQDLLPPCFLPGGRGADRGARVTSEAVS